MTVRDAGNSNDPPAISNNRHKSMCSSCYFILLLQQLKSEFKRTIKWDKYRSQMTVQSNSNNLNYLIDPTFTKINRLFVLSFARNARGDHSDSFSNYYVPNVETKISVF